MATDKTRQDQLDDSLKDTFPASDPVPLKEPKREAPPADTTKKVPKVEIDDSAMPAEKPM